MERLVFDFFGFMWTCIAVNFLQILFVVAGLFGVCQDRAKIVVAVSIFDFNSLVSDPNFTHFGLISS